MAEVSVVVPVYNVREYLGRCVQSILEQTYRDFELLLVDDGSTDGSGELCDQWAGRDGRVRVFHLENAGQAAARNFGVRQCVGGRIAFVDADDYVAPDYLGYLMRLAEETGAGISACQYVVTHGEPFGEGGGNPGVAGRGNGALFRRSAACRLLPTGGLRDGPVCKLFPRNVLEAHPFPEGRVYEDTAVMGQLVYGAGSVVLGNRKLYAYFQNPASTTHRRDVRSMRDQIWANQTAASFFDEVVEREAARLAWDRFRKVILTYIKNGWLPVSELRALAEVGQRSAGSWGLMGLKCRLALVWPWGYRSWCRLARKQGLDGPFPKD